MLTAAHAALFRCITAAPAALFRCITAATAALFRCITAALPDSVPWITAAHAALFRYITAAVAYIDTLVRFICKLVGGNSVSQLQFLLRLAVGNPASLQPLSLPLRLVSVVSQTTPSTNGIIITTTSAQATPAA